MTVKRTIVKWGVRTTFSIWLFIICCSFINQVYALSTDSEQDISLSADSANIQAQTGISIYSGNVILIQGSMQLSSDELTLYHNEQRQIEKIVAIGNPVLFKQRPDGKDEDINANAKEMTYLVMDQQLQLSEQAVFWQKSGSFRGENIIYNMKTNSVSALATFDKSGEVKPSSRVHVTISPQ